jgi:hypothetical protein
MEQVPQSKLPVREHLLMDRPEHIVPWDRRPPVERDNPDNIWGFDMELPANKQNMGELHNLSIGRGTLTDEDRFQINNHVVQTYILLSSLPWPNALKRVPMIAATHHERLDGRGYPRRLNSEKLTVTDRVMALTDVFEALTTHYRPYAIPKKLSQVLRIMASMVREHHLDGELFRYFVRNRLWEELTANSLRPDLVDAIDETLIEELLKATVPA